MKKYTIKYSDDNGLAGEFVRNMADVEDLASTIVATVLATLQALPEDVEDVSGPCVKAVAALPVVQATYWGWFRQALVSMRASVKRAIKGTKTEAGMSQKDANVWVGSKYKIPSYGMPTENVSPTQKLADGITALKGQALKDMLRSIGTPENAIDMMAAAIEAKQAQG